MNINLIQDNKIIPLLKLNEQLIKYRYKLIKFWAQSFLVGIPKIIIAYRNNDLKVNIYM